MMFDESDELVSGCLNPQRSITENRHHQEAVDLHAVQPLVDPAAANFKAVDLE